MTEEMNTFTYLKLMQIIDVIKRKIYILKNADIERK